MIGRLKFEFNNLVNQILDQIPEELLINGKIFKKMLSIQPIKHILGPLIMVLPKNKLVLFCQKVIQ